MTVCWKLDNTLSCWTACRYTNWRRSILTTDHIECLCLNNAVKCQRSIHYRNSLLSPIFLLLISIFRCHFYIFYLFLFNCWVGSFYCPFFMNLWSDQRKFSLRNNWYYSLIQLIKCWQVRNSSEIEIIVQFKPHSGSRCSYIHDLGIWHLTIFYTTLISEDQ